MCKWARRERDVRDVRGGLGAHVDQNRRLGKAARRGLHHHGAGALRHETLTRGGGWAAHLAGLVRELPRRRRRRRLALHWLLRLRLLLLLLLSVHLSTLPRRWRRVERLLVPVVREEPGVVQLVHLCRPPASRNPQLAAIDGTAPPTTERPARRWDRDRDGLVCVRVGVLPVHSAPALLVLPVLLNQGVDEGCQVRVVDELRRLGKLRPEGRREEQERLRRSGG